MEKIRNLTMEEQKLVESFLKKNHLDLAVIPGSACDKENHTVQISCTDGPLYKGLVADTYSIEYLVEIHNGKVAGVGRLKEEIEQKREAEELMKSYGLNPEEWFFLWNVKSGIEVINIAERRGARRILTRKEAVTVPSRKIEPEMKFQ